jgi:hypothetical protein
MMIIIDEALKRENGTLCISEVQELLGTDRKTAARTMNAITDFKDEISFIYAERFQGYGGLYSKEKTIKITMAERI